MADTSLRINHQSSILNFVIPSVVLKWVKLLTMASICQQMINYSESCSQQLSCMCQVQRLHDMQSSVTANRPFTVLVMLLIFVKRSMCLFCIHLVCLVATVHLIIMLRTPGLSIVIDLVSEFNLPLHRKVQKFSSATGSPGWSREKGHKIVVVWCGGCV